MTFKESLTICLKRKYADFNGRASRSEFWWFYLFNYIVGTILGIGIYIIYFVFMGGAMLISQGSEDAAAGAAIGGAIVMILLLGVLLLISFALMIPFWAVSVRRFHDMGKSGWWLLIGYLIGLITCGLGFYGILIWLAMEGTPGDNEYGPVPPEHPDDFAQQQNINQNYSPDYNYSNRWT